MRTRLLAALAAIPALAVAGCGGSGSSSSSSSSSGTGSSGSGTSGATKVSGGATTVKMSEYQFQPAQLTSSAGKLRITATNTGKMEHELVLLKTNRAPGSLPVHNGRVSESKSVGEIAETPAGKSGSHMFKLKPGRYVYVCNIPGHYKAGMHGSLVVK